MPVQKKTGRLSAKAEEFIRENSAIMTPEAIADNIGKSVETVEKYIYNNNLVRKSDTVQEKNRVRLRQILHDRSYWPELKNTLTAEELDVFEDRWISLFKQFEEDVQPTEEFQLQKYILTMILRQRALLKLKDLQQMMEDMKELLSREKFRTDIDDDKRRATIIKLTENIQGLTSESGMTNKELRELMAQETKLEQELKGTRNQRIQKITDADKNFASIMMELNDPRIRKSLGVHLELMREAALKEKHRISQPHLYFDKHVGVPLLTSETVDNLNYSEDGEEEDNKNIDE